MDARFLVLAAIVSLSVLEAVEGHRSPCNTSEHFRCFNGDCVLRSAFCDSNYHCEDASDEKFCNIHYSSSCPFSWLHCTLGGRCYPREWKCDGRRDCPNYSDERGCGHRSCMSEQFHCLNKDCVNRDAFCDSSSDCLDESDEEFCYIPSYKECPYMWLRCTSGERCYPREWKCDGRKDCPDNSDEKYCVSETPLEKNSILENKASKYNWYFLERRKSTNSVSKWGLQLPKIAISLFFMDNKFFAPGNMTGGEISYELSLQLMSKLALKKSISTQKLALYINALIVACINPRNFFGVDMVAELRSRVDVSNTTNPFTYLTLCNARDEMKPIDVSKLQSVFDSHHRPLWTDTQAFTTMAMACISSNSNASVDDNILNTMVAELKRKQQKNGTIDNLRTTALVLQAVIASGGSQDNFNFDAARIFLIQQLNTTNVSFSDMYYTIPVLNVMSLININSSHCSVPFKTDLEILSKFRENLEERIPVQVSIFIESQMDFVRTWKLKVPANYSFYQVIENIGTLEPTYKAEYSVAEDKKPYVTGLAKHFDDAENGVFWFIYSRSLGDSNNLKLIEKSPVDITLKENEELILWYKSGTWTDSMTSKLSTVTPRNSTLAPTDSTLKKEIGDSAPTI